MGGRFSETTDWQGAAWAFAIWAAHFSLAWGASSTFPGGAIARWIAVGAAIAALAGLAALWRARSPGARSVMSIAAGIAALAIVFGALPAVIG